MIVLGCGGFAREFGCWAIDAGYRVEAYYQNVPEQPKIAPDAPIITSLGEHAGKRFIVAVGDPQARARLWAEALGAGLLPHNPVVHPTVVLGHRVMLDAGVILCPMVVVTANVQIGRGVIINLSSTVGHDSILGMFTTVSPGANISGNCSTGIKNYIGTNACLREGVRTGDCVTIGMGAVVTKDIPSNQTWVGNPARRLEKLPPTRVP